MIVIPEGDTSIPAELDGTHISVMLDRDSLSFPTGTDLPLGAPIAYNIQLMIQ